MLMPLLALIAAAPAEPARELGWLSGYWLMCEQDTELSATWSDDRGGLLIAWSLSKQPGRTSWVMSRIEPSPEGARLFILPRGMPQSEFEAVAFGEQEVLFETSAHPFPRRIRYRRIGDELSVTLEGEMNGRLASSRQQFSRAPLNQGCGAEAPAGG